MAIEVKRARRGKIIPQVVLMGGPGSGKTFSALRMMKGIGAKKVVVIDTENRKSEYYADDFDFSIIPFKPPYSTDRYLERIGAAVDSGSDGLIIDQATYEWSGTGGVLDSVDNSAATNDFVKWKEPRKIHNSFLDIFVNLKIPTIINVRAKVEYAMERNERGKMVPIEKGYEAVQGGRGPREKFEFEFPVVFLIKADHHAVPVKDMTGLFAVPLKDGDTGELDYEFMDEMLTEKHGRDLARWARGEISRSKKKGRR